MFEVLKKTEDFKKTKYDIIMSLPPTSPFRTINDVTKCLKLLINSKFDSVWTVSENDSKNHPYKQLIISKNNNLKHFLPYGKKIFARQQLGKFYFRNGCCYVVNRQTYPPCRLGNLGCLLKGVIDPINAIVFHG